MHDDGWSISTADGSLSAHFEHTVAVTEAGPRILTAATPAFCYDERLTAEPPLCRGLCLLTAPAERTSARRERSPEP